MGCQTDIAPLIVKAEADYVLALKGNQGTLHQQVQDSFDREPPTHIYTDLSTDHGRVEKRVYSVLTDLKWVENAGGWSGLQTLIGVRSEVFHKLSQQATSETRHYSSSIQLIDKEKDSQKIAQAIRGHWGIEVSLHWSLDVSFNEDKSRIRTGYSDQNLSAVRKIALNLLRADETVKRGIKTKRMKAGWDNAYLKSILRG